MDMYILVEYRHLMQDITIRMVFALHIYTPTIYFLTALDSPHASTLISQVGKGSQHMYFSSKDIGVCFQINTPDNKPFWYGESLSSVHTTPVINRSGDPWFYAYQTSNANGVCFCILGTPYHELSQQVWKQWWYIYQGLSGTPGADNVTLTVVGVTPQYDLKYIQYSQSEISTSNESGSRNSRLTNNKYG